MSSNGKHGCVIIANNTTTKDGRVLDYISCANQAAHGVKRHIGYPVTLLTSQEVKIDKTWFDDIIKIPAKATSTRTMLSGTETLSLSWDNDYRVDAIDYTPYQRTMLIDADYFVSKYSILPIIMNASGFPFVTGAVALDLTGRELYKDMEYLNDNAIKHLWATVMVFDKDEAKPIFDAAKMVRDNYEMYALLTGSPSSPFRNDIAFSIACHILNVTFPSLNIYHAPTDVEIVDLNRANNLIFNHGGTLSFWTQDFHMLNKSIALDPTQLQFIKDWYDN